MRCWVYMDGFNLYHGAAKRTGYKWLDLLALSRQLRKHDSIEHIKYFTALVERRTDDPGQRQRQRTYWRALDTPGCVARIEGHFTRWPKYMPLNWSVEAIEEHAKRGYNVVGVKPTMVEVLRSEEKGSDVNLAVHLVNDAHQANSASTFEVALVVSTDADLAGAIRIVTQDIGKPVYVCRPNPSARTRLLNSVATSVFDLRTSVLRASQFPPMLTDARGTFQKPPGW